MIEIQLTTTQFLTVSSLGFVFALALIAIAFRVARLVTLARWRNRALQSIASAITAAAMPESEKEKRQHEENNV